MKGYLAVSILALSLPPLKTFAQGTVATPKVEVATVKPNVTGETNGAFLRQPGGRFVAANATLKGLIAYAYRIRSDQIVGGPSWIDSDHWNVEARAEEGSIPTPTGPLDMDVPDAYALMLRSVLIDRFQLKIHPETKEAPAYNLVVASGGPKPKLSEDQSPLAYLGPKLPS